MKALDQVTLESFARDQQLDFVALFGSRALGRDRPDSDWDLALMPSPDGWNREPAGVVLDLVRRLDRADLDVVWLPQAPWLLGWEVAQASHPLYEARPGAFHRFGLAAAFRKASSRVWEERGRAFVRRCLEGRWQVDTDLVSRHMTMLAQYLRELEQVLEAPSTQFLTDFRIHRIAERQLELMVECAGTINNEVSQAVAGIPPSDEASSFFSMARTGWVEPDTAETLALLALLRNRLVHHYLDLNLVELERSLRGSLPHWRGYLAGVLPRLEARM